MAEGMFCCIKCKHLANYHGPLGCEMCGDGGCLLGAGDLEPVAWASVVDGKVVGVVTDLNLLPKLSRGEIEPWFPNQYLDWALGRRNA